MNNTYTPLTLASAHDLLQLVSQVRKTRTFAVRNISVDAAGRGSCVVTTNATPERIKAWFSEAQGEVARIERRGNEPGYTVYFNWRQRHASI